MFICVFVDIEPISSRYPVDIRFGGAIGNRMGGLHLHVTPLFFYLFLPLRTSKKRSPKSQKNMFSIYFLCAFIDFPDKTMKNNIYFFILCRPLGLAKKPTPIGGYVLKIIHSKPNSPFIFLRIRCRDLEIASPEARKKNIKKML